MSAFIERDDETKKLYNMIKDLKFVVFTTVCVDGTLVSRPMYNQDADNNGELWFFSYTSSNKMAEIQKNPQVNLGFGDASNNNWVSISGKAEITRDPKLIEAKWSEGLITWFPKGKSDPEIALIRVHPEKGEYWDGVNSKILHLYGYVKARMTGESPHEMTDDVKVNLEH